MTTTPVFAKALADAKAEIASVEGRRSRVTVTVTGADAPHVIVDEAPLKQEALGIERFIDPGRHTVDVTADGYKPVTTSFDVAEGKAGTVTIALEKAAAVAAAPVAPTQEAAAPASSSGSSLQRTLGITALAVGGAGLILGSVTGALAVGKHSELSGPCGSGTCPASSDATLDSYHTMGTLSTAGFIIGGLGVAGGAILLLTAPKRPSASASAAMGITPYVGYRSLGAVGRF